MAAAGEQPRDRNVLLAKCALALALVPCCPPTGVIGAFLGLIVLHRMRAAGTTTGMRIAVVAVIAGSLSSIIWLAVIERFATGQDEQRREQMAETIRAVIAAAQDDRPADASALWSSAAGRPTGAAITELGRATAERYGPVDRVAIVSSATSGLLDPIIEVACVVHFEQATPLGSARFRLSVSAGSWTGAFVLTHLRIEDPERGDLRLGEPPARDRPAEPVEPAEPDAP